MTDDGRVAKHAQHQEQQDEVEAHASKVAQNDEQGDEAAADDEVEAHRNIRTAIPPRQA